MGTESLPQELIEKLRRTGIRLDRNGRFWHEGGEITHERFRKALLRWLDVRAEDGRPILRIDDTRYAYVDVEDSLLLVTSLRWEGTRALIRCNDETEEELAYDTLCVGQADRLYCRVRNRRLSARITTPAYYVLAQKISETESGFALTAAGELYSIAAC